MSKLLLVRLEVFAGEQNQRGRDEENHQAVSKAELLQGMAGAGGARSGRIGLWCSGGWKSRGLVVSF